MYHVPSVLPSRIRANRNRCNLSVPENPPSQLFPESVAPLCGYARKPHSQIQLLRCHLHGMDDVCHHRHDQAESGNFSVSDLIVPNLKIAQMIPAPMTRHILSPDEYLPYSHSAVSSAKHLSDIPLWYPPDPRSCIPIR